MEKTTAQQIAEFEEACNIFGYGTKGRVIGILKALQAENEALKKALGEVSPKDITGESIVEKLHALPEEKRLSANNIKDMTIASPHDFELIKDEKQRDVLHIKKSVAEKIEAGAKADDFLKNKF